MLKLDFILDCFAPDDHLGGTARRRLRPPGPIQHRDPTHLQAVPEPTPVPGAKYSRSASVVRSAPGRRRWSKNCAAPSGRSSTLPSSPMTFTRAKMRSFWRAARRCRWSALLASSLAVVRTAPYAKTPASTWPPWPSWSSSSRGLKIVVIESGGDNLAATFSTPELADRTIYVISRRGRSGDKIPRRSGPGITRGLICSSSIRSTWRSTSALRPGRDARDLLHARGPSVSVAEPALPARASRRCCDGCRSQLESRVPTS